MNQSFHYVCASCRLHKRDSRRSALIKCLSCNKPMYDIGKWFRCPRKSNDKGWKAVVTLIARHERLLDYYRQSRGRQWEPDLYPRSAAEVAHIGRK